MTNCIECKDILKPDDSAICNECLMRRIHAARPSFITENKSYPQIIRENYDWDGVTWKPKIKT